MEKATLTIPSYIFKSLVIGILISVISVFIIDHFGKFSYLAPSVDDGYGLVSYVPHDTKLQELIYHSPLGAEIIVSDSGFNIGDMRFTGSRFNYFEKVKFYFRATFLDYTYIIIFSILASSLIIFFKKFKLRLS